MASSLSSIQTLVTEIKKELFSHDQNVHKFVSPSAYDTAWLAMLSHPKEKDRPLFKGCLEWILNHQREGGHWGEDYGEVLPTIDTLPATLACLVALRKWDVGEENIGKGLAFMRSKAAIILEANYHHLPRWFAIVFTGMIELAQATGLDVVCHQGCKDVLSELFSRRQQILEMEKLIDESQYNGSPLLSYLESLPSAYHVDQQDIVNHLSKDGSLFQSPSATARAYMVTGNPQCMNYLKALVERCPLGVPTKYPMDGEFIKLCMVDHVQRLGLAEHFHEEINQILNQVYRNQSKEELRSIQPYNFLARLYKNALAFRLLRIQGYDVNPRSFCWFLSHAEVLDYIEQNYERLSSVLYNIYRAAELAYIGDYELEEARSFTRKLLEKSIALRNRADDFVIFPALQQVIKQDLALPWTTRFDHLDHRLWIEENESSPNPMWIGKASFYRLSCLHNEKLMQLASANYELRQSIYAMEMEEMTRWSKETGFSGIGFGREKTAYCYFAVAASTCFPHDSILRLLIAKSAIVITVADDFYDMEGSRSELEALTEAVQRWDDKNLTGHGKTIFDGLNDLVSDTAVKCWHQTRRNMLKELKDVWRETFLSWMMEKTWSDSRCVPSMDEYLNTGMISIAVHTLILPASCFLSQNLPNENLKPGQYAKITKLTMAIARLLNDTQSYQKEQKDGKMNLVMLHLKENLEGNIEDSVAYVKDILGKNTKEFLEYVLRDDPDEMSKPCKQLHLSCMKVFYMFFNSSNLFDTRVELLHDINKAIYIPLHPQTSDFRVRPPPPSVPSPKKKEIVKASTCLVPNIKYQYHSSSRIFMAKQLPKNPISMNSIFLWKFA